MLHLSSVETFNSKLFETSYQKRGNDQRIHDRLRGFQYISFWLEKLIASVRDDTKNKIVELFLISSSFDFFEFTALTTICQLLTLNEIFKRITFFDLMNIDYIVYTVIDKALVKLFTSNFKLLLFLSLSLDLFAVITDRSSLNRSLMLFILFSRSTNMQSRSVLC